MPILTVLFILWIYVSFNYQNWKHIYKMWQLKRDSKRITKEKSYKTVEEFITCLEKRDVWYKELWLIIRINIERFIETPENVYDWFKYGIQRWKRGWADSDVWSIDWFLAKILPEMLNHLKNNKLGVPGGLCKSDSDEDFKKAQKKWNQILNTIIFTFETARKIQEHNWIYIENEKDRKKQEQFVKTFNRKSKKRELEKLYLMTKQECKKYRKGWRLLEKYFFSLWD